MIPTPLVPEGVTALLLDAIGQNAASKQILARNLSEISYNVFNYIILFLRELLKSQERFAFASSLLFFLLFPLSLSRLFLFFFLDVRFW
jgi:hypothetical protein